MSEQQQSLAVRGSAALSPQGFDDPTKELIRKAVSDPRQPLTNDEFNLFISVCQHTGLNPLLKEIYATRMDGRFTVIPSIDGYRKKAQQSPRFRGMAGPFWCGPDGQWTDVWLEVAPPLAAKVGIYVPGQREPTWGIAYYKNYKAKTSATWKNQPEHMLSVRAEMFALRRCFARELGALPMPHDDDAGALPEGDGALDAGHVALPDPGPSPRAQRIIDDMQAAIDEGEVVDATPVVVEEASADLLTEARGVYARAKAQGLEPTIPNKASRTEVETWLAYWRGEVEMLERPGEKLPSDPTAEAAATEREQALAAGQLPMDGEAVPESVPNGAEQASNDDAFEALGSASDGLDTSTGELSSARWNAKYGAKVSSIIDQLEAINAARPRDRRYFFGPPTQNASDAEVDRWIKTKEQVIASQKAQR